MEVEQQVRVFMKEQVIIALFTVFVLSMGIGCVAQDRKVNPTLTGEIPAETKSIKVKKRTPPREPLLTVKATIQAIDSDRRVVTLEDLKGKVFDLKVGEEVDSLAQMKIGDEVVTKFYEWAVVDLEKAGKPKGTGLKEAAATAKPGEEPAGVVREPLTVTATIEEIDHPRTHVTIKEPDGRTTKVFVRKSSYLKNVGVGDEVVITYIEALAISMEKAK
jgi:hypothetical protein